VWVNCLKSLKKPSIYPLGKTPSAPSVLVLDRNEMTDGVLFDLLKMGILDWEAPNDCLNQTTLAICHSTAMMMQMLSRVMQLEAKVGWLALRSTTKN